MLNLSHGAILCACLLTCVLSRKTVAVSSKKLCRNLVEVSFLGTFSEDLTLKDDFIERLRPHDWKSAHFCVEGVRSDHFKTSRFLTDSPLTMTANL